MTDYCQFCQEPIGPGRPSCPIPGHGKSGHHAGCCDPAQNPTRRT